MASKLLAFAYAALAAVAVSGAALEENGNWLAVQFPRDSPVLAMGVTMGPTTVTTRGSSLVIDMHASLMLRNIGDKPICGLTLRVEAQDLSPYGKGSVIKPSLFVLKGEEFPVKVDMQLIRPVSAMKSESAMVQVTVDCALFSDLKAYGPDKLSSRRELVVYELQARRDRQYLTRLLETGQLPELREELNFGIQDYTPHQLGLELLRGPHSAPRREQALSVGPVAFPQAPMQPLSGAAQVAGNEVRSPRIDVRNTSKQRVSSVAMGWIVRDERGTDFVAGAVTSRSSIGPVQTYSITESGTLRFSRPTGQPMVIDALMAFVNDVEFSDGTLWIPSRADIAAATSNPVLRRELATSPEEQRLARIYRREGTDGLKRELKRVSFSGHSSN